MNNQTFGNDYTFWNENYASIRYHQWHSDGVYNSEIILVPRYTPIVIDTDGGKLKAGSETIGEGKINAEIHTQTRHVTKPESYCSLIINRKRI